MTLSFLLLAPLLMAFQGSQGHPALEIAKKNDPRPKIAEQAVLLRLARQAGNGIHWIRDPYEMHDRARAKRRLQPPSFTPVISRRALLDSAMVRAKAEHKLVLVYVCRIEGRQMYRAPLVDDYMNLGLFSDPELVEFINRRFVPIRLYMTKEVGLKFGMFNGDPTSPSFLQAVEPALLVLEPRGKMGRKVHLVERMRTFSVPWTREVLRKCLDKYAKASTKDSILTRAFQVGDGQDKDVSAELLLAEQLLLDGHEDEVVKGIPQFVQGIETKLIAERKRAAEKKAAAKKKSGRKKGARVVRRRAPRGLGTEAYWARARWIQARALRLSRNGDAAIAALAAVQKIGIQNPNLKRFMDQALGLEMAQVLLRMGKARQAAVVLQGLQAEPKRDFLLGAALWQEWRVKEALAAFGRAAYGGGAEWSWRAAGMLALSDDTTPLSPLAHGFEMLAFGDDDVYKGMPDTTEWRRGGNLAKHEEAIVAAAFRYLLSQQRPDGSWSDTRYAYWPAPKILPNVRVAVTALASTALHRYRHLAPEVVDAALKKAETYLLDPRHVATNTEEEVYSQSYRLLYFARRVGMAEGEDKARYVPMIMSLMKDVARIQDAKTGFFAHEYQNAFCTGSMMWSLLQVKQVGQQVNDEVVQLGLKALLSARREDGSYSYGGSAKGRRKGGSITSNLKNSSARMRLCETVLLAFGRSDKDKVDKAFEAFLDNLSKLARVRKCDFHSDGQLGGFFFWHGVFHASEAQRVLGREMQRKVRSSLRALVLSIPEIDGSFVDSHELGKSYGTAMALLTLSNLSEAKQR